MNRLRFDLNPKLHPYPNDLRSSSEAWGELVIRIITDSAAAVELFRWQWNLDPLITWFAEHQTRICHDKVPQLADEQVPENISIASLLNRQVESILAVMDDDAHLDVIYSYREAHSLSRGLPGARVPPILIGCIHCQGEISLDTQNEGNPNAVWWDSTYNGNWAYQFDMEDFYFSFQQSANRFLKNWLATSISSDVIEHVEWLQTLLCRTYCRCCSG